MEALHDAWEPFVGKISDVVVRGQHGDHVVIKKENLIVYNIVISYLPYILALVFCHFTRAAAQ